MTRRRLLPALAALLLAGGLALRLWRITADPLWLDEAYSAYAADHSFAFLWQVVPRYETHPPFYYSLLRLWTLVAGDGLRALRLPGIIAGMATLPVVGWAVIEAGRTLGWPVGRRRWTALAGIGLACLAPPLVEMSRQVRPYPVMILVYALATALLLRLSRHAGDGRPLRGRALAAYFVLLAAMLWLHNLGPLYGVALTAALGLAVLRRTLARADWLWLVAGHGLVALVYLPGLAILLDQAPTWSETTWLRFAFDRMLLIRLATIYAVQGWAVIAAAALGLTGVVALVRERDRWRVVAMVLVLAIVPVLLAILISITAAPVFITRTMTAAAVPTLILFALAIGAMARAQQAIALVSALALGGAMIGADVQARWRGPMQDWYGATHWLRRHVGPGDVILAYPNEGALPLGYALRDQQLAFPIRPIPTAVPSFNDQGGRYPTGSRGVVSLPPARLAEIADTGEMRAVPTIWLLRLGAETYDPGDVFLHLLRRDRYAVRSWRHGPIDLIGLRRRPVPAGSRR